MRCLVSCREFPPLSATAAGPMYWSAPTWPEALLTCCTDGWLLLRPRMLRKFPLCSSRGGLESRADDETSYPYEGHFWRGGWRDALCSCPQIGITTRTCTYGIYAVPHIMYALLRCDPCVQVKWEGCAGSRTTNMPPLVRPENHRPAAQQQPQAATSRDQYRVMMICGSAFRHAQDTVSNMYSVPTRRTARSR
jgi:hypothetical protein